MPSSRQLRRLVPGFIAVALVCRTPITSVPPALGAVRSGLDLSPTLAGLTTTLPLLCFGIMAFATPWLVARWGTERTTLVALVVAGVGILTRSAPTVGTFYLGATLMGAGIAILNVVLPAIVRSRFPQQVPRMTSTYTVCMIFGASVASAATAPLLTAGVGWPATLGIWAIPVILALVMWAAAARKIAAHPTGGHAAPPQAPSGLAHVVRLPRTWLTAVFMGMQSLCFYIPLTWIPDILHSHGASLPVSGLLLAVYMGMGIPGSFFGPHMATHRRAPLVLGVFFAIYALGIAALLAGPVLATVGVVVAGFGQGAGIAIALTFIARQRDPHDVPAVSAFAQGCGFLIAAVGPVLAGALFEATHAWTVPILVLLGFTLVQAASGLVLARTPSPTA